jgi:thiol-disulfide isomerase/thioredoxin
MEQLSIHTVARILSSQELSNCKGTDPHLIKFKELLNRFSKIRVNEVLVKNLSKTYSKFLLRNIKKIIEILQSDMSRK